MNDSDLLQAWATHRDEAAFAELVHRHLPLVHASARRQVRDLAVAQEVSQAVFLVLARKADSLTGKTLLSGWLLRTTRFVAARALRAQQRRTHHEAVAAMNPITSESFACPEHWQAVEPHLDAALAALPAPDRDAVVLRFLEGKPIRAVGEHLGVGEDAAKKRVSRAVGRLRTFLAGKGVVLSASALTGLLTQVPGNATPAELASRIVATITTQTASPLAATWAAGAVRDWFSVRVRELLPWAAAALVLVVAGIRLIAPINSGSASREGQVTPGEIVANSPVETPSPVETAANGPQPGPAKILLNVRSEADNRPLPAEIGVGIWGARGRLESRNLRTDEDGSAEVSLNNPDLHDVHVSISAPGHVPIQAHWRRHELVEPILLHTCRLQPGRHLEGVVLDESGTPVADAEVRFSGPSWDTSQRQNIAFSARLSGVTTDASGRFHSDQIPMVRGLDEMSYSVTHPDFIRARVYLKGPESLATNHQVMLQRGIFVLGRVEGPGGAVVSDATVEESPIAGGGERETATTSDGSFRLGPFPPGTMELHVSAAGFKRLEQKIHVVSGIEPVVIQLSNEDGEKGEWERGMDEERTVRLMGTVRDARSGDPVPRFRVRLREDRGGTPTYLGEGHSGRFDWPVAMAFFEHYTLEVDADGFDLVSSDVRSRKDGMQSFEFRVTPGGTARGRVVGPDGQPVAGAVVAVNGVGFGLVIHEDGSRVGGEAPQTSTAADGSFSIRLKPGAETLLAFNDWGSVVVPVAQASNCLLTLLPWGSIEGIVLADGSPAANQTVQLQTWIPENEDAISGPSIERRTQSDDQGRFRFEHVPPGPVAVRRRFNFNPDGIGRIGFGPRQRVEVPAGSVAEVVLGTSGRTLTGRFVLGHSVSGYDWRNDLQTLEEEVGPDPSPRKWVSSADPNHAQMMRAHARRSAQIRGYFPVIQADGSFRIEDVPPGTYRLKLRVSGPTGRETGLAEYPDREELGKLEVQVLVPKSDSGGLTNPLDLGIITIPVK